MTNARLLFWLALSLPSIFACTQSQCQRRLFPAAQVEEYGRDGRTLGVANAAKLELISFAPDETDEIVNAAIDRFHKTLRHLPNFAGDYRINPGNHSLHPIQTVEIHISSPDVRLTHSVNESYTLIMKEDSPEIVVEAETAFGALFALESLYQLMDFGWIDDFGDAIFVVDSLPIRIEDFPAYTYRGLLIDSSRHFLPLNLILANLDAMLMNKMNVLHWHITDSQSFPYLSKSNPELAVKGSYHPNMVYTTDDIKTVIHEAFLRGIRVIPEVDMPGHTHAIVSSHPELMSHCPHPSDPLDPTNPGVYKLVESIYDDLSDLFIDDFFHVGGDEVDLSCWDKSEDIAQWMEQHNISSSVELFELFETRLLAIVERRNKTAIVWQEVFNLNLTLTASTIVDVWKGFDKTTMEKATKRGFKVLLSGCWYLDHLTDNWAKFYSCNPSDFDGRTDLLLGGHASMWGEHVDASNFMSRVWPRASAVAERLWTGNVTTAKANIRQRITVFRCLMVQQGFAAGPTGPGFCAYEVPYRNWNKDRQSRFFLSQEL